MKTFLHVGCGPKHKDQTTRGFNTPDWTELRLDIDQSVKPDIVGTLQASGFATVAAKRREHPYYDLWALG